MKLARRRFLTGAAGAALALPWLEAFTNNKAHAQGMTPPRRIIVVAYPMGFIRTHWQPTVDGVGFTLPFITAPLEPFRNQLLMVSNVDNAVCNLNSQHAFGHPAKKESVLTGTLMRAAFSGDQSNTLANVIADAAGSEMGGPNGPSIEHFIGAAIRGARPFASVDLGVSGENYDINVMRSDFCFEAATTPVGLQCNPARAFDQFFAGVTTDAAQLALQRRARQRKKSVLDLVRSSYQDLKVGLNGQDQRRLDEHAQRVRQIEIDVQNAACARPAGNYGTPGPNAPYTPFRMMSMRERCQLMIPLLANAMGCDLAPVGRLEFLDQQSPFFGVPSVDTARAAWSSAPTPSDWHGMVHGDPSPVDGIPTRGTPPAQYLLDGYRFFYDQLAALLGALRAIPEGNDGRTALDNTLVVMCSDYGNGNGHSSNKLGFTIAGNLNGARSNFHFNGKGTNEDFYTRTAYNSSQVLNTLLRIFDVRDGGGAPVTSFGLQNFTAGQGTLPVFS
ncbi:MAG: DUF1552 domain-containing protein [Archangium sp.]|nr:DUF1552 domain-containing protein [Archangium sp.]